MIWWATVGRLGSHGADMWGVEDGREDWRFGCGCFAETAAGAEGADEFCGGHSVKLNNNGTE